MNTGFLRHAVATVLTVYGIETEKDQAERKAFEGVATVLTVYGIETASYTLISSGFIFSCNSAYRLRY